MSAEDGSSASAENGFVTPRDTVPMKPPFSSRNSAPICTPLTTGETFVTLKENPRELHVDTCSPSSKFGAVRTMMSYSILRPFELPSSSSMSIGPTSF